VEARKNNYYITQYIFYINLKLNCFCDFIKHTLIYYYYYYNYVCEAVGVSQTYETDWEGSKCQQVKRSHDVETCILWRFCLRVECF